MNEFALGILKEMHEKYKIECDRELIHLYTHPNTRQKIQQQLDKEYLKAFDEFVTPTKYIKEGEILKIKGRSMLIYND